MLPITSINGTISLFSLFKTVFSATYIVATLIAWANIFLGENKTGFFFPEKTRTIGFSLLGMKIEEGEGSLKH